MDEVYRAARTRGGDDIPRKKSRDAARFASIEFATLPQDPPIGPTEAAKPNILREKLERLPSPGKFAWHRSIETYTR